MAGETGEKTEKPSAKRLRDARERGQVAISKDVSMALGTLAATSVLVGAGSFLLHRIVATFIGGLSHFGDSPLREVHGEDLVPLVISGGTLVALTAGPIAIAAAATGVLSSVLQSGFNVSASPLTPDFNRLNPANGLRKFAPSRAGIDTLKAIVIASILSVLAWRVVSTLALDAGGLTSASPLASANRLWSDTLRLLWQAGFALLSIGSLDFGLQKWRLHQSLKMTKQEVKDEARSGEGNPEIKARVRRIQRDMFRKRMLQAVPRATVVLTNPTHFAVALEYKRDKGAAPVVIAKGADLIAAKIREIARDHSVPIVENPPLTRALFKECEVGDVIPGPLFGAVAEVLAYLVRIKQLVL
ncbi:MAG TPA: EscU/YscU/HrcU family type III secretion system export apparatus switch protein [Vicinamibacterales bacterium]|jgi:flagellar biosynthetic protein FlhB